MDTFPWLTAEDLPYHFPVQTEVPHDWSGTDEGELALDVVEAPDEFVVSAPIAGVRPEDLAISLHHDMLTVRGKRGPTVDASNGRYLCHECHWGTFSRSVILPATVDHAAAEATLWLGILTVRLPKSQRNESIPIRVIE